MTKPARPRKSNVMKLDPYPKYKDSGVMWLGKVPAHWPVVPNRGAFTEVNDQNHPNEEMLSVTIGRGVVKQSTLLDDTSMKDGSKIDRSSYKLVQPGDIAYNKMRAWQGAIGVSSYRGIISPAYVVQRPRKGNNPDFLHYLLRTSAFAKEAERNSYGIASDMWSLRPEHFKTIRSCLPPPDEQAAIVRYLDHADEQIQRYIAAKERLTALLEEQRQALVHQAVTRGLDPGVRLKPSGVEWMGDVPEHWSIRTLGQIADSFRTGPFGSMLHQSDYTEGGTPVINPIHIRSGVIVEDPRCSVSEAVADRLSAHRLAQHDLIFSRRGELGRCALVRDRETTWLCGTGSIRVRIEYASIEPEFLIQALQVQWVGEYLSLASVGATMNNLNTGILKSVPILVPPVREQRYILEHVGRRIRAIHHAISQAHHQINLMNEYRTRLIADVVTGQLDVRGTATQLPTAP